MKKKIVIFNTVITTVALLILFFSGLVISRNAHYRQAEKELIEITELVASNYRDGIAKSAPNGVRITITDINGVVISDSKDDSIIGVPHGDREEIAAAFGGAPKVVVRKSETTGTQTLYYALKATGNEVYVRVAVAVNSVDDYTSQAIPALLFGLLVSVVVSYLAALLFTDGLLKPLREVKSRLASLRNGECVTEIPHYAEKEVNDLMCDINAVSEKLEASIAAESGERERLQYILGNVSDGIIVLSDGDDVTLANKVCDNIFQRTILPGTSIFEITSDKEIARAIKSCKSGVDVRIEYENGDKVYSVTVKRLENSNTVMVFSDITAIKQAEKERSEFFVDASHELKTPLTSIKGFNDVIRLSSKEPQTLNLSEKMSKQIERVITLIGDMLGLSEIENAKVKDCDEIELSTVAEEVKESLSEAASKKNVSVTVTGNGKAKISEKHAFELIKNLTENGIAYNNEGGKVEVTIGAENGLTYLKVSDNGIGIADSEQTKIFQRFYRVDKSRSRATGGTGLGLAIVKHICVLYGADVEISSAQGVGTEITVTFA